MLRANVGAELLQAVLLALVALAAGCQSNPRHASPNGGRLVEASCGTFQFGMQAEGCPLAVRIDGVPYLVEGSGIDDHGDAHAADGLCNAIRTARVDGQVENGKFIATKLELLPP
jgi:hypothetical protein